MLAFELPEVIPAAGTPGGPPLPQDYHQFANVSFPGDARLIFLESTRDPQQLQPTWDRMMALSTQAQKQPQKSAK